MALTKQTTEHEFLFRWDEGGNPQGCHIAYRESILEDGVEISSRFLDPRAVQLDDAAKLAEIGAAINAAALASNADKDTQIATLTGERDAAVSAKASAEAALAAAAARVQELEDQIAGPVVDGVPQRVTMRQAQLALLGAGLLDSVEAAIAAIPDPAQRRAAEITWTKSAAMERNNPLIAQLAPVLGLTSEQVDQLFVIAKDL